MVGGAAVKVVTMGAVVAKTGGSLAVEWEVMAPVALVVEVVPNWHGTVLWLH